MNIGWFWLRRFISLSKRFSLISKTICFNLFPGSSASNCCLKTMLIDHYGDEIYFSYRKNCQKSQMFFSAKIKLVHIAETLRLNDNI